MKTKEEMKMLRLQMVLKERIILQARTREGRIPMLCMLDADLMNLRHKTRDEITALSQIYQALIKCQNCILNNSKHFRH